MTDSIQELMIKVGMLSKEIENLINLDGNNDYDIIESKIKEIDTILARCYNMKPSIFQKLKLNRWHEANLACYDMIKFLREIEPMESQENGKN